MRSLSICYDGTWFWYDDNDISPMTHVRPLPVAPGYIPCGVYMYTAADVQEPSLSGDPARVLQQTVACRGGDFCGTDMGQCSDSEVFLTSRIA